MYKIFLIASLVATAPNSDKRPFAEMIVFRNLSF